MHQPIVLESYQCSCFCPLYPGKRKEVLKTFNEYYKTHKKRVVYFWFDHTAVGGENETGKYKDVIEALEKHGWIVVGMYIGKAPGHETKYRMYGHLFCEDEKYNKIIRFNRENCKNLILSIGMAEAEQRKDGFGKIKKVSTTRIFRLKNRRIIVTRWT